MTDKRQRLLDAAIRLFHERGFWDTPTALIAREAGVANGTLFNNFPSKTALIDAVYLTLKQEWADHMLGIAPEVKGLREQMRQLWLQAIDWAVTHPERYDLLMQMKLSEHISEGTRTSGMDAFSRVADLYAAALESGELIDIEPDYLQTLSAAQMEAAIATCRTGNTGDAGRVARMSFDILWRGIAAHPQGDPQ